MDTSGAKGRETKGSQPPPGYPSDQSQSQPVKKPCCGPRTAKKGEKGFIEGCLAALCCCWLCETCF